jgi:hypothetical protein
MVTSCFCIWPCQLPRLPSLHVCTWVTQPLVGHLSLVKNIFVIGVSERTPTIPKCYLFLLTCVVQDTPSDADVRVAHSARADLASAPHGSTRTSLFHFNLINILLFIAVSC